jgi:hypothetical protein
MRNTFLLTMATLVVSIINGQDIHNNVIGSAGDEDTISNIVVRWTIGECMVEHFCNDECGISQGFHQSYYKVLRIPEETTQSLKVSLYPNPTSDLLNIDLSSLTPGKSYYLTILDIKGRVLMEKNASSDDLVQLSLSQFSNGLMFLNVIDRFNSVKSSFKIIKVNP